MNVFEDKKFDYAVITFGDKTIEGSCGYWDINSNGTMMRLLIGDKQYMTSVNNVLLTNKDTLYTTI